MAEWVAAGTSDLSMQTITSQDSGSAKTSGTPGNDEDPDVTWCVEIAARIGAGDMEAESRLITRLRPALKMMLTARCAGDAELSADICQDALVILLQRLRGRTLEDPSRLPAFVAQTARQLAFDARRRVASRKTIVDSGAVEAAAAESPEDSTVDSAALTRLVRAVLAELPKDRDREVLRRFYLQDEDKAEICRALSIAPGAFDLLIFRARARLRALLEARGLAGKDLYSFVLPWIPRSWLH
jgi:RNA polymerase sigma-70 factor, ECF subfamily